jgi:hypothetical protein
MSTMLVSDEARRKLGELCARSGLAAEVELDRAVDEYYRRQFWRSANAAYARLKADTAAWEEYRQELGEWDVTLGDGLEGEASL